MITLFYAALLVLWGNLASTLLGTTALLPGGSWAFVVAGLALIVVSLFAARALRLDREVVVGRGAHIRGAAVGLAAGSVVASIGVVALRLVAPTLVGQRVEYTPLLTVSAAALAPHLAFFLPLGDILPEEIAFRGVLMGALVRTVSERSAILVAGATFALWHLAVIAVTVGDTTVAPPSLWFAPAVIGALLVVFVGGAVFAWLRVRSDSLATTVGAHWSFNAVLLIGLWSTRGPAPAGCC